MIIIEILCEYTSMKILETKRLILRSLQMTDLDSMAAIDADPKVCEFLPALGTRDNTAANIQRIISHEQQKGYSLYAVELKTTHEMIGWIGLLTPSFEAHFTPAVEIGWRLASQHWNQGYATEGAKAVLDYALTTLGLEEIVSFTVKNNLASRRVMEKIGLHRAPKDDFNHPRLPGHKLEKHVLYRLTRSEYLSRQHDTILVKKISEAKDIQTCLTIRYQVFVEGQNVPAHEEVDGLDSCSEHYLLFINQLPVGTARVRYTDDFAKIERVAILDAHQGQGLGHVLMNFIIKDVQRNQRVKKAKLGAQTYAISFYEKLGFVICSNEYLDAGIPHKDMQLDFK